MTPNTMLIALDDVVKDPDEVVGVLVLRSETATRLANAKCQFSTITVEGPFRGSSIVLTNIRVRNLEITDVRSIRLEGCEVGVLTIREAEMYCHFSETLVGMLDLRDGNRTRLMSLDWYGGYLGDLRTKPERIRGDMVLNDVQLPIVKGPRGAQWLRDARVEMNEKSNTTAAAHFHAGELVLTRPDEPWPTRFVSHVYEWGSNFGISVGRPVVWFAGILLSIFLVALFTGSKANPEATQGWHGDLASSGMTAQVLRAGIYAMQSIFNPLNLIVSKPLIVIQHWAAALVCFALGLLGIIAFALFLLSIRRRFKLE